MKWDWKVLSIPSASRGHCCLKVEDSRLRCGSNLNELFNAKDCPLLTAEAAKQLLLSAIRQNVESANLKPKIKITE